MSEETKPTTPNMEGKEEEIAEPLPLTPHIHEKEAKGVGEIKPFGDPEVPLTPHIHEKEAKGVGEIKPFGDPEVPLTPHIHEKEAK
ncbi:MAG: hypothetical protein H6Q58_2034, partial [Firmicutes bacterium]|nr:hypothetical protein [Bacillota bacterium]